MRAVQGFHHSITRDHKTNFTWYILILAVPAVATVGWAQTGASPSRRRESTIVRIGMAESLCRKMPRAILSAMVPPFRSLMRSLTNLECDLALGVPADEIAERLLEGKLELGLFQGIEFAWAFQKTSALRPLTIVVNEKPYMRAVLVTAADHRVNGFADLKGRSLAVPRYSHEHCYQFLDRCCRRQGAETARFLSEVTKPDNVEDALDQVVDGVTAAAVVEEVPLEHYRRRKPGRYGRLKVLQRSEAFPSSVVAYRVGSMDEPTLARLRDGMLAANRNPVGRQLFTWWRMTGFEPVPADYEKSLRDIVQAYPAPKNASKPEEIEGKTH